MEADQESKGPAPRARANDATSVGHISPIVFNYKKLTEWVLIAACMSPVSVSPAYPLKKDDKSKIHFLYCYLNYMLKQDCHKL